MSERARPIPPEEIPVEKVVPNEVIEAFNELMAETGYDNSRTITIRQNEVVARIVSKGIDKDSIFKNKWLDVEDIYRNAGWKVRYESAAYNDTYFVPYFTFSRKK